MKSTLFVSTLILTVFIPGNSAYDVCGLRVQCGNIEFEYPFWGSGRPDYCGHPGFQLTCQSGVPQLQYESVNYRVLATDYTTQMLTIARNDLWSNICPRFLYNTTYDSTLFNDDIFGQENISLYYGCDTSTGSSQQLKPFSCNINGTQNDGYSIRTSLIVSSMYDLLGQCENHITVPVNQSSADRLGSDTATVDDLTSALTAGFTRQWTVSNQECDQCIRSAGRCGSNSTSPELFVCYCVNGNFSSTCNSTSTTGFSYQYINTFIPSFPNRLQRSSNHDQAYNRLFKWHCWHYPRALCNTLSKKEDMENSTCVPTWIHTE